MTVKNIYFVQANNIYGNDRRSVYIPYASGCIAAYAFEDEKIRKNCNPAGFIYTHEPIKDAVRKIAEPFVVAFSCSVWNYEYNKALAKEIKKLYPETVIIFGGHNVLRNFGSFDDCPEADILIYREGEEAFRRIILALLENENLNNIANIAFRSGTEYVRTKEEAFCMNEYPSPYLNGIFDGTFNIVCMT